MRVARINGMLPFSLLRLFSILLGVARVTPLCLYDPSLLRVGNYIESLKNDTSPRVPLEDGRNAVKLLECMEESLNEQRPIAVLFD